MINVKYMRLSSPIMMDGEMTWYGLERMEPGEEECLYGPIAHRYYYETQKDFIEHTKDLTLQDRMELAKDIPTPLRGNLHYPYLEIARPSITNNQGDS